MIVNHLLGYIEATKAFISHNRAATNFYHILMIFELRINQLRIVPFSNDDISLNHPFITHCF